MPNAQLLITKIMNHLSLKSLAFYGVAIGSVALLFKVVSAYGETNLKAAPAIGGSYRFDAKSLPECLKSDSLVLTIEQSGSVKMRGIVEGESLKGKFSLTDKAVATDFTAQKEAAPKPQKNEH
jgi:hypothetical protein